MDPRAERYQRQQLVHALNHEHLQTLRIGVIGAGAVGNEVIKNLALLGVGRVDIVDFDQIEIHNLTRSVLFRESDIGDSKAKVAARRAQDINPDVQFQAVHGDLSACLNVSETARYDCIIACVDNFEARMRASLLCRLAAVDFVSVAIDSRYVSVQRHPFGCSPDAQHAPVACYECDMAPAAYQTVAERYSCGWLRKLAEDARTIPTTAITASIAGAQAVSRALALGPEQHATTASRLLFDTHSGHATPTGLQANADCLACGGLPSQLALGSFAGTLASLIERSAAFNLNVQAMRVSLSEALIASCRCTNNDAHAQELQRTTRLTPASKHSEAITWCSICADSSIDVDIIESITTADWRQQFDGDRLDCRFVSLTDADANTAIFDNSSVKSRPFLSPRDC